MRYMATCRFGRYKNRGLPTPRKMNTFGDG
jgi:hypothetical protein